MAKKKLDTNDVEHFIDSDLYLPTRTVYIGPTDSDNFEVNPIMAERAIKNLHILDSKSDEPIEILMQNYGGEVEAGMAIYDAIKLCRSKVIIKVFGAAYSMGSVILQAADERLMSPNSRVMVHYGSESHSNHPKIVRQWVKETEKSDKWMKEMFLEKIREKQSDFKMSELDKMLNFDSIFNPQEAIDLGLADRIMIPAKGHREQ